MQKLFNWLRSNWGGVAALAGLIMAAVAIIGWLSSRPKADNSDMVKALEAQTEIARQNELRLWAMIDSTGRVFRAAQRRIDSLDAVAAQHRAKIVSYDKQLETIRYRLKQPQTTYKDSSKNSILNALPE